MSKTEFPFIGWSHEKAALCRHRAIKNHKSLVINVGNLGDLHSRWGALANTIAGNIRKKYSPAYYQEAVAFLDSLEAEGAHINNYDAAKKHIKDFLARFTDYDANRLSLVKAVACAKDRICQIENTCSPDKDFCRRLSKAADEIMTKMPTRVYGKRDCDKSGFKTEFQFLHQFFLSYAQVMYESKMLRQAIEHELQALAVSHDALFKRIVMGESSPITYVEAVHNLTDDGASNFEKIISFVRKRQLDPVRTSVAIRKLNARHMQHPWCTYDELWDECFGLDNPVLQKIDWVDVAELYKGRAYEELKAGSHDEELVKLGGQFLDMLAQIQVFLASKTGEPLAFQFVVDHLEEKAAWELAFPPPGSFVLVATSGERLAARENLKDYLRSVPSIKHEEVALRIKRAFLYYPAVGDENMAGYSMTELMGATKGERRKEITDTFKKDWSDTVAILRVAMLGEQQEEQEEAKAAA